MPSPASVYRAKSNAVEQIFGRTKAIIGVIHAMPLPGAPNYDGEPIDRIYEHAISEARRYRDNGCDGVIVENHGDIPFAKPEEIGAETVAAMAVMTTMVRREAGGPVGINILANAPVAALASAKASGADFIRVNQWANAYVANEGFMEGKAGAATRYRSWIGARHVRIFTDVHVKHGAHAIVSDRPLEELARDLEFFDSDGIIVTGQRTGNSVDLKQLEMFSRSTSLPIMVGSGVNGENVLDIFKFADAVIVASALKFDGSWWNEVDPQRVRDLTSLVRSTHP